MGLGEAFVAEALDEFEGVEVVVAGEGGGCGEGAAGLVGEGGVCLDRWCEAMVMVAAGSERSRGVEDGAWPCLCASRDGSLGRVAGVMASAGYRWSS